MKASVVLALSCSIFLALLLTGATPANGEPATPASFSSQERGMGPEYQISTPSNPETDRYQPASAYNSVHHQTLVVWHRNDGSYYIEGRLLDATGRPLGSGPTILVSGSTPVYQPAVAYNATDNQYLVVWMRNTNLDGKTFDVWGKILSANLTEVRPEYQIFSPPSNYSCWSPRVAWNSKKVEFMVVWNAFNISAYPAMVPDNIAQETLIWNGDLVGHILVIGNTAGNMIYPQQVDLVYFPTGDPYGKYMWVWKQVKPGTADYDIWAANIDAQLGGYLPGLPPWKVGDSTSDQSNPRIATTGNNDFMVVWQERSPVAPNDWDIRGAEMNQIGTFFGGIHVIAGWGSTDETSPFVAAWPGAVPNYVVGYERQSATGQDIWLVYNNNGANTISFSGFTFWLDNFPAAAYGFYTNSTPTGVVVGPNVQIAYQGVSNTPGDHPHIYTRAWTPFLTYLPSIRK